MFQKFVKALGGDPTKRSIQKYTEIVEEINELEAQFEALGEDALRAKTDEFRKRLQDGETLDDLIPEAFAAVREASKRTIGLRHYDVQMIGGMALHQTKIAEMRTGEGKTLVATLPLYLNALTGKGVHLVTVNDYLARRDARWMAPIYMSLGMTVGVLQMAAHTENGQKAFIVDPSISSPQEDKHQLRLVTRAEAYQTDITYGTNSEFGFDYLRDNLTMRLEDRSQRGHYYAIVDEVDNILIDEARTPLIISGPASDDTEWYVRMSGITRQLNPEDYEINEKDKTVTLTELGEAHVEELLDMPLRDPDRPEDINPETARVWGYLEQALRAQYLYKRNKDYLVQAGKVIIVDEFTGRLMPGRRWSEGLHQAVEAKEGVKVEPENVTYATITLQNYFRMYEKLAGMTGTASTESEEFYKIYKLDVLPIPTNLEYVASLNGSSFIELKSKDDQGYDYLYYARRTDLSKKPVYWKRKDYPDVVFRSEEAKLRAITQEIAHYYVVGRPQLVGTTSVEHSERLSDRLQAEPIRRLMQVLLVRKAWQSKQGDKLIETAIPELKPLNKPLPELDMTDIRPLARTVNVTTNPEEDANLDKLIEILDLKPEHKPRLLKIIQGGVPHQVLNARKHDEESMIIASAGAFGAVTIATNMAGRGVDIKLGGELPDEVLSDVIRVLNKAGYENSYNMNNEERLQALMKLTVDDYGIYEESVKAFKQYLEDMKAVRALGGLHVIGSERHEARRIDNQLRGRAARQGDPGSSRFYLSLEDELMRLFGGQQAEGLFKRLNIDENLPIEHGLLGRLVEQSQERVEGSNFDVRKHLLEYDDVLNSQRKRIYSQRDMVFTKQDLSEDVLEMLRSELQRRVPESLKDEEGPWKLLAFLEEIQPPLDFMNVYHPSFSTRLLLDEIDQTMKRTSQNTEGLRQALLSVGGRTLEAEKEHVIRSTNSLFEKTQETLIHQLDERFEILDNALQSIRDAEREDEGEEKAMPRRPQELLDEISAQVGMALRLPSDQMRQLSEGGQATFDILHQQIEDNLMALTTSRLVGALERRLEENLQIKPNQLAGKTYGEISERLLQAVETVFTQRYERMFGSGAQVEHDLEPFFERLGESALEERNKLGLLQVMSMGVRMAFDQKTHQKTRRSFSRLNYVFLAARLLESTSPQQVTDEVLDHLERAQETLQHAWGITEYMRLQQNGYVLEQLDSGIQDQIAEKLSDEVFDQISRSPLIEIGPDKQAAIQEVLGNRFQNAIYRQILLGIISEQWVDYLTKVEALRVSIGLEAYAQRDPLVQYKSKASEMFQSLLADIRMGVVSRMFTYQPRIKTETPVDRDRQDESPALESSTPAANPLPDKSGVARKKRHRH